VVPTTYEAEPRELVFGVTERAFGFVPRRRDRETVRLETPEWFAELDGGAQLLDLRARVVRRP
jgi:hypothetical protein